MSVARFASVLFLAVGLVYCATQGRADDCAPPTVTDQLVWATDANGKQISPNTLPTNPCVTAFYITTSAKLKNGSTYSIDATGTPSILTYQVKNGKG